MTLRRGDELLRHLHFYHIEESVIPVELSVLINVGKFTISDYKKITTSKLLIFLFIYLLTKKRKKTIGMRLALHQSANFVVGGEKQSSVSRGTHRWIVNVHVFIIRRRTATVKKKI